MYVSKEQPQLSVPVTGLEEAIQKTLEQRDAGTAPAQPAWERNLKRGLALVVALCTATVPFLSATTDAVAFKVCGVVIGFGAALGITSRGNPPKQ